MPKSSKATESKSTETYASYYLTPQHKTVLSVVAKRFDVPVSALVRRMIEALGVYHQVSGEAEINTKKDKI